MMPNYTQVEQSLARSLSLTRRPVAVAFRDERPVNLAAFAGTQPSGCSFWQLAAAGQTIATAAADHYNCPIGSYTHNIALPPEREQELPQTLGLMSEIGYLRMADVPGIPTLPRTPGAIVYAPLGETPVDPDVVLVCGKPGSLMLLQEAGTRAGVPLQPLFGRPTCMAIPAALSGSLVSSLGCVGNRIYNSLGDEEMYTVIPASRLMEVTDQLATINGANQALSDYHNDRVVSLRS